MYVFMLVYEEREFVTYIVGFSILTMVYSFKELVDFLESSISIGFVG